MVTTIPMADPEIAALAFHRDIDAALASQRGQRAGWAAEWVDDLTVIVHFTAVREHGAADRYAVRLRGHWYDSYPPQVTFVVRSGDAWVEATPGSPGIPNTEGQGDFALHPVYAYPDQSQRQLVCCSMSFDYYISNHTPTPTQQWRQGRHKAMATITRIQDALTTPRYKGPANVVGT